MLVANEIKNICLVLHIVPGVTMGSANPEKIALLGQRILQKGPPVAPGGKVLYPCCPKIAEKNN